MDKQFARILMLSVLLPAGVSLAKVLDHDYTASTARQPALLSQTALAASADVSQRTALEGRRFMQVITAEENAAVRRRDGAAPAHTILTAAHKR